MENTNNLTPHELKLATSNVKKLVLINSIPTIISMFINALYNVVDRFWVGKIPDVGEYALAGVGITMPIMMVIFAFSMLVGLGGTATISIYLGKRDKESAEKILGNILSLSLIFSLLVMVVVLLFKTPILLAIGASETVLPYASDYITIIILGTVFQILSFALNHPIRATGNAKRFARNQLVGAFTNIILDPIFIVYFKMGVKGAAIATVIAMIVSTVITLQYYFSKDSSLKFRKIYLMPDIKIVKSIFAIGFSPFLMQALASATSLIVNRSLRFYGDLELGNGDIAISAMTVIMGVFMMALMPVFGINQGSQPIIGFNFGAKDYKRVKEAFKWSVVYALIISSAFCILIEVFAGQIVASFNDSPELIKIGTIAMRVIGSSIIFIGFQSPAVNFFTAIGRAKISAFLSLLRQVIILIPAYFILPRLFGLAGLWYAQPISDILSTLITFIYIKKEFEILKKMSNQDSK